MPRVTAILVARNGAEYLERTLASLSTQTRQPDALVVVDAGSTDASGTLLEKARPLQHVVGTAKSGLERHSELMFCPEPNGRMLITGSNFAREGHPAWTANLAAHPDASVTVRGRDIPIHATRVPDDEIEAVWAWIEQQWPGYRGYERSSGRTLRIFRLTPERSVTA